MRVGILEICESSHYLSASNVAKIYASEPTNQVFLFLDRTIAKKNKPENYPPNSKIIASSEGQSARAFFEEINGYQLDILHINTVSRHLALFADFPFCASLISFSIHNTEEWFDNSLLKRVGKWWFYMKNAFAQKRWKELYVQTVMFGKNHYSTYFKNKFINQLHKRKHKFVVYTAGQADYLSRFVSSASLLVLPMALYEFASYTSFIPKKEKLRICIPGVVDSTRRDYSGLLRALRQHHAQVAKKFVWDFLGYIPDYQQDILSEIQSLQALGVDILYYPEFIGEQEFDRLAAQSDFILGNLKVQLNPYQIYGKTKESTTIFHMIKYAKPGLFPNNYTVEDKFRKSILFFSDYHSLIAVLLSIHQQQETITKLTEAALAVSEMYTPARIYATQIKPYI